MSNQVEVTAAALPQMTSVERISKLPIVESTVDLATNLYGRVKDSNTLVNSVLSTAETTVKGAVGKTLPVANKFEGPIKTVDTMLCSGLDFVENKLPVVKLPPEQIYNNTKEYVFGLPGVVCACQLGQQGVLKAVECACALSEYSTEKLHGFKQSLAIPEKEKTDIRSLLSIYLYTLLNVLALVSTWVGFGQIPPPCADGTRRAGDEKMQINGNGPVNSNHREPKPANEEQTHEQTQEEHHKTEEEQHREHHSY